MEIISFIILMSIAGMLFLLGLLRLVQIALFEEDPEHAHRTV